MLEALTNLEKSAQVAIEKVCNLDSLENLRIEYLGRKEDLLLF
jgi:hypothetical protein